MQRIYNTGFEIEPRVILIADTYPLASFSEDLFVAIDFMAVYSGEFITGTKNLHGDNGFKFSEITARRQSVHEAVKKLVLEGLLIVEIQDGFQYRLSDIGKQYAESFESNYAVQYRKNLLSVYEKFFDCDEKTLSKIITEKALADGREEM